MTTQDDPSVELSLNPTPSPQPPPPGFEAPFRPNQTSQQPPRAPIGAPQLRNHAHSLPPPSTVRPPVIVNPIPFPRFPQAGPPPIFTYAGQPLTGQPLYVQPNQPIFAPPYQQPLNINPNPQFQQFIPTANPLQVPQTAQPIYLFGQNINPREEVRGNLYAEGVFNTPNTGHSSHAEVHTRPPVVQPPPPADGPLSPNLYAVVIPPNSETPYVGTFGSSRSRYTDPTSFVSNFRERMRLHGFSDAVMCRLFPTCLEGPAFDWYNSLPPGSITHFPQLSHQFLNRFGSVRKPEVSCESLMHIRQTAEETTREYLERFVEATRTVADFDDKIALIAV